MHATDGTCTAPATVRIAIIGAGATGMCMATQLIQLNAAEGGARGSAKTAEITVDLFEQSPAPFGLLSPERLRPQTLNPRNTGPHHAGSHHTGPHHTGPHLRVFGNLTIGSCLAVEALSTLYDAVVLATSTLNCPHAYSQGNFSELLAAIQQGDLPTPARPGLSRRRDKEIINILQLENLPYTLWEGEPAPSSLDDWEETIRSARRVPVCV